MATQAPESFEEDVRQLLEIELPIPTLATFAYHDSFAARLALERIARGAWPACAARIEQAAANLVVLTRLMAKEGRS